MSRGPPRRRTSEKIRTMQRPSQLPIKHNRNLHGRTLRPPPRHRPLRHRQTLQPAQVKKRNVRVQKSIDLLENKLYLNV